MHLIIGKWKINVVSASVVLGISWTFSFIFKVFGLFFNMFL